MAVRPISVSQLNDYLARVIGTDPLLSNITVRGEASGVKYHSSGHIYFSLVDRDSQVRCFLSRNNLRVMDFLEIIQSDLNGRLESFTFGWRAFSVCGKIKRTMVVGRVSLGIY